MSQRFSRDIATIAWASTSRGFCGISTRSIRASYAAFARVAHSMRSHGSNAIIRPVAVSPYAWPARPIRWRPLATDLGDPIWTTRSIYPMSMPSSRDVEETAALSLPSFSFCSTPRRVTFEREPWWASRSSTPRSFRRKETCSEANTDETMARLRTEAFEPERQERSAPRRAELVDIIEGHPLDAGEVFEELGGAQDDCDALRRRDEDMGRPSDLPLPLLGGRVPGPHADADLRLRLPLLLRQRRELSKRFLEVSVDVVREGLQRGDVEAVDPVLQFAAELFGIQLVDDREEGRERLPTPRGRRYEDALPLVAEGDGVGLRLREVLELRLEPVPDEGLHEPEDLVFRGSVADLM